MLHRNSQSLLDRPTASQSRCQGDRKYSEYFSPFCKTASLPLVRQQAACSPISSLLFPRSPFAVGFFVVSIVIFAFNRMLHRRARSHVFVKCLERMPSLAYANASSAVAGVSLCRVVATLVNLLPYRVFRSSAHSVLLAADDPQRSNATTSAASAFFGGKSSSSHGTLISTVATAEPVNFSAITRHFRKNKPLTKPHSGQVFESWVTSGRLCFSHDDTSYIRLVRTTKQRQLLGVRILPERVPLVQ